jgi:hypothetical protein
MAEGNVMQMVGAFIGIAIMLGIGIQILGNAVQDCTALPDYDATRDNAETNQTGWAGQCVSTNTSSQSAYALLVIILIVVAAVAILFVVRML